VFFNFSVFHYTTTSLDSIKLFLQLVFFIHKLTKWYFYWFFLFWISICLHHFVSPVVPNPYFNFTLEIHVWTMKMVKVYTLSIYQLFILIGLTYSANHDIEDKHRLVKRKNPTMFFILVPTLCFWKLIKKSKIRFLFLNTMRFFLNNLLIVNFFEH
jgi:hypothetical protein